MIHCEFIGRLGVDAETKISKKGESFLSMRVATDDYVNGNKETVWVRVTCPPNKYLNISDYLKKGTMIHAHGVIRATAYKNKNEEYVVSYDLMADRIDFVPIGTSKEGNEQKPQSNAQATVVSSEVAPSAAESAAFSTPIDDLPF